MTVHHCLFLRPPWQAGFMEKFLRFKTRKLRRQFVFLNTAIDGRVEPQLLWCRKLPIFAFSQRWCFNHFVWKLQKRVVFALFRRLHGSHWGNLHLCGLWAYMFAVCCFSCTMIRKLFSHFKLQGRFFSSLVTYLVKFEPDVCHLVFGFVWCWSGRKNHTISWLIKQRSSLDKKLKNSNQTLFFYGQHTWLEILVVLMEILYPCSFNCLTSVAVMALACDCHRFCSFFFFTSAKPVLRSLFTFSGSFSSILYCILYCFVFFF